MKNIPALVSATIVLLLLSVPAQAQRGSVGAVRPKRQPHSPELPRVAVWEAYMKFKSGKAILLHAGGMTYEKRHIVGAIKAPEKLNLEDVLSSPRSY